MIILEWETEYWQCGKEMVIIILKLLIFKLVMSIKLSIIIILLILKGSGNSYTLAIALMIMRLFALLNKEIKILKPSLIKLYMQKN